MPCLTCLSRLHVPTTLPVPDVWVDLRTARRVATELDLGVELSRFLDSRTVRAWSYDDGDEHGVVHNWKVPNECISPSGYTMEKMLS